MKSQIVRRLLGTWLLLTAGCTPVSSSEGNIKVTQANGQTRVVVFTSETMNQIANLLAEEEGLYDGALLESRIRCAEDLEKLNPRKTREGKEATREDLLPAFSILEVPESCGGRIERE